MNQPFRLFLNYFGRIQRATFAWGLLIASCAYISVGSLLSFISGDVALLVVCPVFIWVLWSLSAKRYHDLDKPAWRLLLVAIPIAGPLWVAFELFFRKGEPGANRFGIALETEEIDYAKNPNLKATSSKIVNDVTQVNPIEVGRIERPQSEAELVQLVRDSKEPLSIGGGRFSMGGQTASPGSLHVDMRSLNRVVGFWPEEKVIRVQAGIRWADIQKFVDPHDLSVSIMQTYANFTVGGSLSVNCHGRYVGQGPLILSVRALKVLLADGRLVETSPTREPELFSGCVGGYGGLGIIVEAELKLSDNVRIERTSIKLSTKDYLAYFKENVRNSPDAVFHNADLYPPHYGKLRAVTWTKTDREPTVATRLQPIRMIYPIQRYFFWAFSETPFGKWRREYFVDPLVMRKKIVHWRNFEAGYDVAELEPVSRKERTYVLQEYFVPIERMEAFVKDMGEIFGRHRVNIINVSIRHAHKDSGSILAWAREEMFAFVVYYKQRTRENAKNRVGVWTREMVDAVCKHGGTYYLPYQIHPTAEQFHKAYPRASEFFALKRRYDPDYRLRNALWDAYYAPTLKGNVKYA